MSWLRCDYRSYLVEFIENFLVFQHVGRDEDVHDGVGGPEGHGEDADGQVDLVPGGHHAVPEVGHVLLECGVDITGQLHVFKHSFQFRCKTSPENM